MAVFTEIFAGPSTRPRARSPPCSSMAVFTEIVAGLNPEIPRHKEYGPNSLDELGYKEYLDSAERWVKDLQSLQWGIVPGIDEDAFYRNGINDFVAALESIQLLEGSDANASREAV